MKLKSKKSTNIEDDQSLNDENDDDTEMTDFTAQNCSKGSGVSVKSKPSPSSSGRPMHENWYGYKKVYVRGKHAAECLNCSKTFPNTGKLRLKAHR